VHHKDISDNKEVREVTSLDIEPVFMFNDSEAVTGRRPVKPVEFRSDSDKSKLLGIPIVKLNRGEQINLRFDVEKGIGKMHTKWSPVSLATFQPDPEIKINHEIETSLEEKQLIRDACPTRVFQIHNDTLEVVFPDKCIFCTECQRKAEAINLNKLKNYIKIGKKKDRFIFTVESIGSMPAAVAVKKAMTVLREKLESIDKMIDSM
jgi:DNA-directed RNA polymerase alpha subunit